MFLTYKYLYIPQIILSGIGDVTMPTRLINQQGGLFVKGEKKWERQNKETIH